MTDQQQKDLRDQNIRAALNEHWAASDANINVPVSQAASGLKSDESLAAVLFGSPNSS